MDYPLKHKYANACVEALSRCNKMKCLVMRHTTKESTREKAQDIRLHQLDSVWRV